VIYTIPIDVTYPSVVQETTLDGITYRLLFRWNARAGHWYLTLRTLEDVEIMPSKRLVAGARLLRQVSSPTRPPGDLLVLATPTRSTLGNAAPLIYFDAASVAEIEASA
jgi:hypothetical protein